MDDSPDNWIYSINGDNSARFLLGQPAEKRLLLTIGVNPSTASPENLDPTVTTVRNRAAGLGFDGWCTINLYPQRSTDPNGMDRACDRELHERNLGEIRRFAGGLPGKTDVAVWAAWGALMQKRPYLADCLEDIYSQLAPLGLEWFSIGKRTKDGHPHHPLYLRRGLSPESFDIAAYLRGLREA